MPDIAQLAPKRCLAHDLFEGRRVLVQEATTMALDVAGFTSLTDRLSASGTRATEQLSGLLHRYFAEVTDLVAAAGGDPVAFGGDSLSIIFDGAPRTTLEAALEVAALIQKVTARSAGTSTYDGPLVARVRLGIARGAVATGVARSGQRLLPVHVGPGLDMAHEAQEGAVTGQVAVHESACLARTDTPVDGATGGTPHPRGGPGTPPVVDVSSMLSPVVLDRLLRGEGLVESHREVTVAFARFPAVEPGALPSFLATVGHLMGLVAGLDGEVVQVSGGDKGVLAMVVFGAPTAHGDDAARAVQAMLELRRRERKVAVGVATGPVFAALLGSRSRLFPTHLGMAVNVAARLSQLADPGRILVGARTWECSAHHLRSAGQPRPLQVKGSAAPVVVREVAGWRRTTAGPTPSAHPRIVGRLPELARIEEVLDDVAAGRGGVLVLEGEAGSGKTRLAREAVERSRARGFAVLDVDVADHPPGRPVGFWRDVVGALLDVRRNAPRRVWQEALRTALPHAVARQDLLLPLLGLDDPTPAPRLPADDGPLARELARASLGTLLRDAVRRRSLVLVVDNVDRLDDTSLDVLRGAVDAAKGCAVGFLMTRGRGDEPAVAPLFADVPTAALTPLGADEIAMLAELTWRQLGGGTPPSWLAGAVVGRAGGNPLFGQVVTDALRAVWKPGDPPPKEVTARSVASLLVGRVDRLSADARALLTVLAVARRPCSLELLSEMLVPARDPSTLSEVLGHLAREGVAESLGDDPEGSYRLAHDLLRQVVYETTSHALREQLHRRLVHCLDTARVDPVEVAEHVHATGDESLARRWFPLAAQAARESWNLTAAVRWWEALHPLLDGSARDRAEVELLEVLLVAGRANDVLDRVEGADAHRWSAVTGNPVPVSEDGLLSARRLLVVAEATYSCGRLADTEEAASRVMELADGVDEPRYQRAGELLTLSRCHQGDVDGALRNGRALVDRATRSKDPASRANASAALGAALVLSGSPEAAQGCYEAALTWAVEAGDVVRQVHVLSDLAGCAYLTGRRTACVELLGQAREAAESIGYRRHLALNLNNEAQLRAGSADPFATSCAAVAVDGSLELGDLPTAADALHTWLTAKPSLAADPGLWHRLAEVDVRLGRFLEAAGEWAELAVALGRSGRREEALEAARRAEEFAQGPDAAVVGRRAAYARIVADAHAPGRPRDRARLLAALDLLADGAELDERETAEIAVERWRLSRRQPDRGVAVARVSEAFEVEPSALVRSWFRTLREPLPAVPKALPPPVGIRRGRATRRDLELALLRVERAAGAHWDQERRRPSAC